MKRIYSFLLILIMGISLLACNSAGDNQLDDELQGSPHLVGFITNKDDHRILVVSSEAQDFSSTGGVSEFYDAAWVSNVTEDVEIGMEVEVWFDGAVAESYPAQGSAKKINILPPIHPEGATLNKAEATKKALEQLANDQYDLMIVKNVTFNADSLVWELTINETSIEIGE
ncbi:YobA family protein [Anaerobacillus sp. MEB173]|uniref:YobA family protein n=1 Tax=Anaerobacillus sp. MEB173 TaxID=3383345 RepID=UPI003F8F5DDB